MSNNRQPASGPLALQGFTAGAVPVGQKRNTPEALATTHPNPLETKNGEPVRYSATDEELNAEVKRRCDNWVNKNSLRLFSTTEIRAAISAIVLVAGTAVGVGIYAGNQRRAALEAKHAREQQTVRYNEILSTFRLHNVITTAWEDARTNIIDALGDLEGDTKDIGELTVAGGSLEYGVVRIDLTRSLIVNSSNAAATARTKASLDTAANNLARIEERITAALANTNMSFSPAERASLVQLQNIAHEYLGIISGTRNALADAFVCTVPNPVTITVGSDAQVTAQRGVVATPVAPAPVPAQVAVAAPVVPEAPRDRSNGHVSVRRGTDAGARRSHGDAAPTGATIFGGAGRY